MDAGAGKKKATRDAEKDEEVSLIDEEEEDMSPVVRVAVFNVDMSTGIGKAFENSGIFAKIKTLESQKKKKDLDAIKQINERNNESDEEIVDSRTNERTRGLRTIT